MRSIFYRIFIFMIMMGLLEAGLLKAQIKVEPTAMELACELSKEKKGSFTVSNLGALPLPVRIVLEAQGDHPGQGLTRDNPLHFSSDEFVLKPGEKKVMDFSCLLRSTDEEAVYMVYFVPSLKSSTAMNLCPRFGSCVYVYNKENAFQKAADTGVELERTDRKGEYSFNISLTNQGNIHISPQGFLIISDKEHNRIGYHKLVLQRPILAKEKKSMTALVPYEFRKGSYLAEFVIFYGPGRVKGKKQLSREFIFSVDEKGDISRN